MVSNYIQSDCPSVKAIIPYLIILYISFLSLAKHISHFRNLTISNVMLIMGLPIVVLNHEIIIMVLELMGNFHNISNKAKLKLISKFQKWIVPLLF